MPYKSQVINNSRVVADQPVKRSHFYKGFSTIANLDQSVRLYDFNLIKQDILNHFRTRKGERVMNPTFGSVIWDLIMEPLTEETRILLQEDITNICNSDPRVTPTQLDLTEYDQGYVLEITLLLNGTDQSVNMKLQFDQQIGLVVQ